MFPPEIWNEILLYRCFNSLNEKLRTDFHIDPEHLCEYLTRVNGIISGFFIIACLFDNDQYGDLDIYYQNNVPDQNPCKTFNQVFLEDFQPGKYEKTPVCIDPPSLRHYFPDSKGKNYEELEKFMFKYHRKLQIEHKDKVSENKDRSIDLIQTPIDPKEFMKQNVSMDFLNVWFDGRKFYFPYKLYQFLFRPFGKILSIGSIQFELYYNPHGDFFGAWTQFTDHDNLQHSDYSNIINEILKFPQRYWKRFQLHSIRNNYIGKENVTDYRLVKTIHRIIKYTSRGIHLTNVNQFFKARKTYLQALTGKR